MTISRLRRTAPLFLAAAGFVGAFVLGSRATGPAETSVLMPALVAWGLQGTVALVWLAMAWGFGGVLVDALRLRRRDPCERITLELALGIGIALAIDHLLGTLGLLVAGRGAATWALTFLGLGLFVWRTRTRSLSWPPLPRPAATVALGVPAGILCLAATSEPGWLWSSEKAGYDALSYHLQLPKEWLYGGSIETLPHNVYSALPSFVEAAFLHLAALAGGHEPGGVAAQCLAALVTLVATGAMWTLGRRIAGTVGGALAAALYLGTPWIGVVGSLAYNDGWVPLFLAALLLLVLGPAGQGWRTGVAIGILAAAALGAKLTAIGFAVAPFAAVFLLRRGVRAALPLAVGGAVTAALLAPWLVRNGIATGNPLFPFATGVFGPGPWSAEQAATFAAAHSADGGVAARLTALWHRWFTFGLVAKPASEDIWGPQWSVLPWVGLAGLVALAARRRTRAIAVGVAVILAMQVAFWLTFTHLQSRFLLPTAVPLALAGAALVSLARRPRSERTHLLLGGAAFAWCLLPWFVFRDDGLRINGQATPALAIGGRDTFTGEATRRALLGSGSDAEKAAIAQGAPPAFLLNSALPPDLRVLLIGDARPFWYRPRFPPGRLDYTTVWDRGPFEAVAAAEPDAPQRWREALVAKGYDVALVDVGMLALWHRSGWLDPLLTKDRIEAFIGSAKPIFVWPQSGVWLLDLREANAAK